MSNFTPGPWAISSTGSVVAANGGYVAEAYDGRLCVDTYPDIAAANAALIAAAPELYEALNGLLYECIEAGHGNDTDYSWPRKIAAARSALLRAQAQEQP